MMVGGECGGEWWVVGAAKERGTLRRILPALA